MTNELAEAEWWIRSSPFQLGLGSSVLNALQVVLAEYDRRGGVVAAASRFVERNYSGSLGPKDLNRLLNDIAELSCAIKGVGEGATGVSTA